MRVRTRLAPSPTGRMHVGTVRTGLFNYLYAKKHGGDFIVRIEDTDHARSEKIYEDAIWEDLAWLGINADERYRQSEHKPRHTELLDSLVKNNRAYISKEEARDGSGRVVEVVRLKNPGGELTFTDTIRGDITFDTTELGDFVIARSLSDPLYHFAVVADDGDEDITHVIRGDDHISNTPRQILIQRALGLPQPTYAHLPLILAPDKSRLSKRKHSASVADLEKAGFLPEAIVNFLALVGWNPGTEQEIFNMEELVQTFELENIQKSGAVFNIEKLKWFNKIYLHNIPDETLVEKILKPLHTRYPKTHQNALKKVVPLIKERIHTWADIQASIETGEWNFLDGTAGITAERLQWKNSPMEEVYKHLEYTQKVLRSLPESHFEASEGTKEALWGYAEENGRGNVLWPLRMALTGQDKSPDPFTVLSVLGKEESLRRIQSALEF